MGFLLLTASSTVRESPKDSVLRAEPRYPASTQGWAPGGHQEEGETAAQRPQCWEPLPHCSTGNDSEQEKPTRRLAISPAQVSSTLCIGNQYVRNPLSLYINIYVYMCGSGGLVTHLCPTLCDPKDSNLPGSSVLGISQARKLPVAISFPRGSF